MLISFVNVYMCGRIGTDSQKEFARQAPNSRLYLNTESPADYDGTVAEWNFCYYRPSTWDPNNNHLTAFAVYRLGANGTQYDRVSETLTINLSNDHLEMTTVRFVCDVISPNVSLIVQAGDVLGACIRDLGSTNTDEPNILGRAATGHTLLRSQTDLCDGSQSGEAGLILPSHVLSENLEVADSNILDLFGNISIPTCNKADSSTNISCTDSLMSCNTNATGQVTVETNSNTYRFIVFVVGVTSAAIVTFVGVIVVILLLVICFYKVCLGKVCKQRARRSFQNNQRIRNSAIHTSSRNDASLTYNATYFASPNYQSPSELHPVYTLLNGAYVPFSESTQECNNSTCTTSNCKCNSYDYVDVRRACIIDETISDSVT